MKQLQNFINNQFHPPISNKYIDGYNPATGKVHIQIPDADEQDVAQAVTTAKAAFPKWSNTPIEQRSRILLKISELIEANLDRLALAESQDNGKPLSLAKKIDIPRAASNFRFFATAINHESTEAHYMEQTAINYTLCRPIGVVGCISPWNLPLYLFTWKIAPAIAAGNCVIAKPSEITPLTAFLLCELCIEAGLPEGVLNVLHGYGPKVGQAIVNHPSIKAISFTGGTKTGAMIAAQAAPKFKKLSLELGGKNPNIIFADCDYDLMLETTLRSSFANQGQICLAGSRIFVEKPLYERFKKDFVEGAKALKVGDPLAEDTNIGAVVSKDHQAKILSYIDLAKEEGGSILCGGRKAELTGDCARGYFIEPTIIEGLSFDARTNQEEIFGPVVTITPFEEIEEVLHYANSTAYGLSATIWTTHLQKAHQVAHELEAGIVWVNCWLLRDLRTPFGGVKHSGVGREGGWEALRFFTEMKNVCVKL